MTKYEILLHFYIFLIQKHKKHKNTRKKKDKKESNETLASWDLKSQIDNLNFGQTLGG